MKNIAKGYIISLIIVLFVVILFLIISAFVRNVVVAVISTIILIVLVIYLFFKIKNDWFPYKRTKILEKQYNEFKSKRNPVLFEELYMSVYDHHTKEIFKRCLGKYNIDGDFYFDVSHKKRCVAFIYSYRHHNIFYYIYDDKIDYYIYQPIAYSYLEINKEDDEAKKLNISINGCESLESFFDDVILNIEKNINSIDDFLEREDVKKVDLLTIQGIIDYQGYYKTLGRLLFVLSIIALFLPVMVTIFIFNSLVEMFHNELFKSILGVLGLAFMYGLFIYGFYASVYVFVHNKTITKDIKLRRTEKIVGKPYKIKFIKADLGRGIKFYSGIKFYFRDSKKIKLIFAQYIDSLSKEEKRNIKEIFLMKVLELEYYKKSKMITSGAEYIRKQIKKMT